MEAVIFVGIQAAGKSTFYRERFFDTHVRINRDMLKTKHREAVLLDACLRAKQPFVVDNTNVTAAERARYVAPAKAAGFRVVGYFVRATGREAIARNRLRTGKAVIPIPGILGTLKKLEEPTCAEGFDALYTVTLAESNVYVIEEVPREGDEGAPTG
jgi:predicted kinase